MSKIAMTLDYIEHKDENEVKCNKKDYDDLYYWPLRCCV
jgi:hypothetical protein